MRFFLTLFLTICITPLFSQKKELDSFLKQPKIGEKVKVIFDISAYSQNKIGEFKDELISHQEGLDKVHYDEILKTFTLVYNDKIKLSSITYIFNKYGISYKNNSNISTH